MRVLVAGFYVVAGIILIQAVVIVVNAFLQQDPDTHRNDQEFLAVLAFLCAMAGIF